ncbi:RNA polymerase sigma factor [Actinomadura napierensis]|uniref:RNA polymerase sigma-70 region 2 domain-containing protein n=1 Tax=Actinomadura napierensis TaxID=267854 RepID=A0ABN3A1Y9_9ACTN
MGLSVDGLGRVDLDGVYRAEYGRCVATLTRLLGDIGLAEEAVQDAFATAVQKWDRTPPNPGAWIVTTARNRAIDRCAGNPPARPATPRPCC